MSAAELFHVFFGVAIFSTLLVLILLPIEGAGDYGHIPVLMTNVMAFLATVFIVLSIITYFMR